MNLKEIMKLGILVEPDVVDNIKNISKEDEAILIKRIKEDRPLVLSNEILKSYLKKTSFKIVKYFRKTDVKSMQDTINLLNEKYKDLQQILVNKADISNITSINKCSSGRVGVIGIVGNIEEKGLNIIFNLEDPTGIIDASIKKELAKDLCPEDIIYANGTISNKILFIESFAWPDAPLRQPPLTKEEILLCFLNNNDLSNADAEADYYFILNCDNKEKLIEKHPRSTFFILSEKYSIKDKIIEIPSPCIVNVDGINILILKDFDPLISIKKRYVNQTGFEFIINPIPDIIFNDKGVDSNYKGISIISKNKIINLKTREIMEPKGL